MRDYSKHECPAGAAPVGLFDTPPYTDPGQVVQIDGSGEYGRVRLRWRCCGTVLVERLTPEDTTVTDRYPMDALSAPQWGDSYAVPCLGAAWSMGLPCGHIAGEGCACVTLPLDLI